MYKALCFWGWLVRSKHRYWRPNSEPRTFRLGRVGQPYPPHEGLSDKVSSVEVYKDVNERRRAFFSGDGGGCFSGWSMCPVTSFSDVHTYIHVFWLHDHWSRYDWALTWFRHSPWTPKISSSSTLHGYCSHNAGFRGWSESAGLKIQQELGWCPTSDIST